MNGKIGFLRQPQYKGLEIATLFERYCAYIIDVVIVCLVGFIFFLALSKFGDISFRVNGIISEEAELVITATALLSLFGYDCFFLPSIGRSLVGLKILYNRKDYNEYKKKHDLAEKPIHLITKYGYLFGGAYYRKLPLPETLRGIIRTLLIPLLPLSIIIALTNKEGKMIHDLCFDTVTVRESEPALKIVAEAFAVFITVGAVLFLISKYLIK